MKEHKFEDIYENEKSFHDSLAMNAENSPKDIEVWEEQSWDYMIETIGNLNGKRILDIGCGFGRESILFAKKGAIVTGMDISDKSIEFARKRIFEEKLGNINFETLNIDDLAYADFFDVVFCRGSLHHFPDVPKVIDKAYDSLKSGGIMIVQEPKSENPIAIIGRRFF